MESKIIWLGLFFIAICNSYGQSSDPNIDRNPNIHSPQAAALGYFGMIETNPYNGLPQIEIPIYELKYKNIQVPIKLNYNASGNKPDNNPGWVGLGWTLEAGGAIIRNAPLGAQDVEYTGLTGARSKNEFIFNFLGISGVLFRNTNAQWCIKSKENLKLSVTETMSSNYPVKNPDGSSRIFLSLITSFTMTTPDGTKYVFGENPNAIEYVRSPDWDSYPEASYEESDLLVSNAWNLYKIITLEGDVIEFDYSREFSRARTTYTEMYWDENARNSNAVTDEAGDVNQQHHYISYMSFLKSITIQNYASIWFNKTSANELQYSTPIYASRRVTENPNTSEESQYFIHPGFQRSDGLSAIPKFFKLENIEILDNNQVLRKKVQLDYIENSTERLKLSAVKFSGTTSEVSKYQLEYNPLKLPAYDMGMEDHWGFYNGRNFWNSARMLDYHTIPDLNAYYASREPDPNYLQAEMLTKIIYPTGGSSTLVYEPHEYKKVVKKFPVELQELGNNTIAGGLRIKKIITEANGITPTITKEYFYIKDYLNNGTSSSGVVSGLPVYLEQGYYWVNPNRGAFGRFSSEAVNHLDYSNGSHVTYSEVVEKNSDGGYTLYRYSNHDNGYSDKPPFTINNQGYTTNLVGLLQDLTFGKLDFERGLMLEKSVFTDQKKMIKQEIFTYNDDPNRYQEFVQATAVFYKIASANATIEYPVYTFWPYLKSHETIDFHQSNSGAISTIKNYKYDYANRLTIEESSTNSKGEIIKTSFTHPTDYPAIVPYSGMIAKNYITPVIERTVKNNNVFLQSSRTNYDYWNGTGWSNTATNIIVPHTAESKTLNQTNYEVRFNYQSYDVNGNITSLSKESDVKRSYLWGYNNVFPVADAINAASNEIYFGDFEKNGWDSGPIVYDRTMAHTGKYSGRIDNLGPGEQSVHANSWLNIALSQPRKFKYSGWYYSNGPSVEILLFMKTDSEQGYYTYIDAKSRSETNKWTYIEGEYTVPANITKLNIRIDNNGVGTVWFDDIRLHPADAPMSTYTYEPLVGMTSQTDFNNQIKYYDYDPFGRLSMIRDNDKNILKKLCYNYKGEPEDCSVTVYKSKALNLQLQPKNCAPSEVPGIKCVYVPEGQFFSTFSQEEANLQAYVYAQSLVTNQACLGTGIYARVEIDAATEYPDDPMWQYWEPSAYVRFYSDPNCTQPLTLIQPLTFKYKIREFVWQNDITLVNDYTSPEYTFHAGAGTQEVFINEMFLLYAIESLGETDQNGDPVYYTYSDYLQLIPGGDISVRNIRPTLNNVIPLHYYPDYSIPCQ